MNNGAGLSGLVDQIHSSSPHLNLIRYAKDTAGPADTISLSGYNGQEMVHVVAVEDAGSSLTGRTPCPSVISTVVSGAL